MMQRPSFVWGLVIIQIACGSYFIWEVLASVLGWPTFPLRWQTREFIEIGAGVGLVLGVVLGVQLARSASQEALRAKTAHRLTPGEFTAVVQDYFNDLGLTPAESETAWFLLKGHSMNQIAKARATAISNVRTLCKSIYRKAGVRGKSQLFSYMVEYVLL